MKKFIIIAVILAAAALTYYFFIYEKSSNANPFQVNQIIAQAFQGDLITSIHSNGTITPVQTVEVKSKASGEIIEMTVDVGDYLKKGQLICRLDTITVMNDYLLTAADYDVAKATVKLRQRELERQQSLYDKKLLSEQELDNANLANEQAKSDLVRAQTNLSTAQERLDDTEVRSPIDGILLRKTVEKGQIISSGVSSVSGGTLICQVAAMDSVYVIADVDETDIGQVSFGQKVNVAADAYPDLRFSGKVLKIAPIATVDQNVTVFEVTSLIDNKSSLLKAGMNCSAEIVTSEAIGATLVPNGAVKDPLAMGFTGEMTQGKPGVPTNRPNGQRRNSGGDSSGKRKGSSPNPSDPDRKLILVKKDGQFVPEMVTIGRSNLDYTQIIAGVSVGDTVDATPTSLMMEDRARMRERMMQMSSVPGMKKNN